MYVIETGGGEAVKRRRRDADRRGDEVGIEPGIMSRRRDLDQVAPRDAILTDVIAMLQDLADKGFLTEAREKTS